MKETEPIETFEEVYEIDGVSPNNTLFVIEKLKLELEIARLPEVGNTIFPSNPQYFHYHGTRPCYNNPCIYATH
ncbi:MAG: hypothetical protein ACR2N3_04780 [Pyrinomonadaceae bacterium]